MIEAAFIVGGFMLLVAGFLSENAAVAFWGIIIILVAVIL